MTAPRPPRGGAPVGHVHDLDAVEAGAVLYLRLWCEGAAAQDRVRADFTRVLGAPSALACVSALKDMLELCACHGRRPIMRHDVCCSCVGADEACFAQMIASAASGNREDAMLIATLLVRPDVAPSLTALAESLGLALARMSVTPEPGRTERLH